MHILYNLQVLYNWQSKLLLITPVKTLINFIRYVIFIDYLQYNKILMNKNQKQLYNMSQKTILLVEKKNNYKSKEQKLKFPKSTKKITSYKVNNYTLVKANK